MSKIDSCISGYYRVPLATVLTDSMHGEMKDFELVTVRAPAFLHMSSTIARAASASAAQCTKPPAVVTRSSKQVR